MGLKERENRNNNTPVNTIIEIIEEQGKENKQNKQLKNVKVKDKYKLRQQSYYLAEDHIKAIEMRIFSNKMIGKGEIDKSALVRTALDKYLKNELIEIRSNQ